MLAGIEQARDAVRDVRELRGGTLSFGMYGTASDYLIADLVGDFRRRYPDVRLRLVGQNSSLVADACATDGSRRRSSCFPSTTTASSCGPSTARSSSSSAARPSASARPMTIERLAELPLVLYDAEYGWADPTRRQLAERAQPAGVTLPARGRGGGHGGGDPAGRAAGSATRSSRARCSGPCAARARSTRCRSTEPMWETFAFIARHDAPVSPATRAFIELVERRLERLGELILYQGGHASSARRELPVRRGELPLSAC